jgi:amino acid permease
VIAYEAQHCLLSREDFLLPWAYIPSLTLNSYALRWLIALPIKLIAASLALQYWAPDSKLKPVWVIIHTCYYDKRHQGFGDVEAGPSIVKIVAVIDFM